MIETFLFVKLGCWSEFFHFRLPIF